MAVNDLFEMVTTMTFGAAVQQNRYYYLGDTAGASAAELAEAFDTFLGVDVMDIIHDSFTLSEIAVTNLTNLSDQELRTTSIVGKRLGQNMRNFYVLAMELNPVSPLVGVGRKAYGPVAESDVNGGALESGYQVFVDSLKVGLAADLLSTAGERFLPVMYSPANLTHAFDIITSIDLVEFKRLSTQNSRKNW